MDGKLSNGSLKSFKKLRIDSVFVWKLFDSTEWQKSTKEGEVSRLGNVIKMEELIER